jgi:probable HAF family extracellular repeat protein
VANGINDRGQIVGISGDLSGGIHGFLRSRDGEYTNFDDPNAVGATYANGINNHGKIVGYYPVFSSQGFLVGQRGFLLSDGQYTNIDYPNATSTGAQGINDRGQIVGFYVINPNAQFAEHAFLLSDGQYTTLDDPNAVLGGIATGINDRGQIVGYYFDANDFAHGFLLSHASTPPSTSPTAPTPYRSGSMTQGRSRASPTLVFSWRPRRTTDMSMATMPSPEQGWLPVKPAAAVRKCS